MIQNLLEKLQLKDEKNLLIQGLPSSIEKQFSKLSFAKNVTPLLKARKIDFALVFAINEKQLNGILHDVIPALQKQGKLWVSYPKKTSKIVTDLDKEGGWFVMQKNEYESIKQIALDHVWTAVRFKKIGDPDDDEAANIKEENASAKTTSKAVDFEDRTIIVPNELEEQLKKNKPAFAFFEKLSFTNKKEYVEWIIGAKKDITKQKRIKDTIDKLVNGKKNPSEK
jgi:hypothetical protein